MSRQKERKKNIELILTSRASFVLKKKRVGE